MCVFRHKVPDGVCGRRHEHHGAETKTKNRGREGVGCQLRKAPHLRRVAGRVLFQKSAGTGPYTGGQRLGSAAVSAALGRARAAPKGWRGEGLVQRRGGRRGEKYREATGNGVGEMEAVMMWGWWRARSGREVISVP